MMGTIEASRLMTRNQIQNVDAEMYHWKQANPNAMHGDWERAWITTAQRLGYIQ